MRGRLTVARPSLVLRQRETDEARESSEGEEEGKQKLNV